MRIVIADRNIEIMGRGKIVVHALPSIEYYTHKGCGLVPTLWTSLVMRGKVGMLQITLTLVLRWFQWEVREKLLTIKTFFEGGTDDDLI